MRRKRRFGGRSASGAGGKSTGRGSKRGTITSLHHRPASGSRSMKRPRPEEGKRTLRSSNCDIQQSISTEKQPRDQETSKSCDVFMHGTKPSNTMPQEPRESSAPTPTTPVKENGTKAVSPAKQAASKTTGDSAVSKIKSTASTKKEDDDCHKLGNGKDSPKIPEVTVKKEESIPKSKIAGNTKNSQSKVESHCPEEGEPAPVKTPGKKKRSISISGSSVKSDGSSVEDNGGPYLCTYCDEVLESAHDLTSHIRQHNNNDHTHTCRLCGKTLSSASSLDRHMLVHSGERPFKCKLCGMAFTTNGNMHRHMRTHGESEDSGDSSKPHPSKAKKPTKRKSSQDSETRPPSSPKKPEIEPALPEDAEQLHCPVCAKTFLCKYGLQTHMDTHPNDPIYCKECGSTLRNYTVFMEHQCSALNGKQPHEGQNGARIGFQDLSFVDFSAQKFTLIAKTQCEYNARRPSSAFHAFECFKCKKAFPCSSALHMHLKTHTEKTGTYCPSCDCNFQCEIHMQTHQLKHRKAEQCEIQDDTANNCDNDSENSKNKQEIPLSNKDDFFALLQLQNRGPGVPFKAGYEPVRKEEPFESPSYFIHGKPLPSRACENEEEPASDFADIQSIISVTSTAALMSSIRSSPIAASPVPSVQVNTRSSPESPLAADSANASPDTPSKEDSDHSLENQSDKADDNAQTDDQSAGGNDTFSCKSCNQVFKSSNALKRHNRSHSQGCTVYSCNSCSYTSLDKSTLIRHMRTHNGERPFQCAICKFAFTTKANCERHVRKRHKKLTKQEIKNAMQYNPNMAEQKAPDVIPSDHSNSETRCKYCNVDFKFNRVLRHHLRSLNNSCSRKPYCCSLCRLGFSTKNNCIRHVMKQHPNMKDKLSAVVSTNAVSDTSDQESAVQMSDDGSQKKTSFVKTEAVSETPADDAKPQNESLPQIPDPHLDKPLLSSSTPIPLSTSPLPIPAVSISAEHSPAREAPSPLLTAPPVLHAETRSPPLLLLPPPVESRSPVSLPPLAPSFSTPLSLVVSEEQPLNLTTGSMAKSGLGLQSDEDSSIADRVLAANSLVSLSEMPPPQEEPLNLAPHALDLSVKPRVPEATDLSLAPKPTSIYSLSRPPSAPLPMLPVCYSTASPGYRPVPSRDVVPLHLSASSPAVCTPIPSTVPHPVAPSLESVYKMTFKMVNQKLASTRSQRSFQCEYCSAGFTLKSNMERHIKRKHPEFARPTRSRNFIPALIHSNTPKQGGSTLSSKTRAALRDVLSNKANSLAKNIKDSPPPLDVQSEDQASSTSSIPNKSFQEIQLIRNSPASQITVTSVASERAHAGESRHASDDSDATPDLASVSSVIDTANTQAFRKYFSETPTDDKPSNKKEQRVESKSDSELLKSASSEQSNSDGGSQAPTKKRSAYADSPNSVSCPHCPRKFPWSSSLQRHLLTHTGHKPYKCPKCPIYFTTKSNCERHLLRKHGQTREVVRSTERAYKCNACPSSSFSTPGNLRKHYYLKHWMKTSTRRDLRRSESLIERGEEGASDLESPGRLLDSAAALNALAISSVPQNGVHRCQCCNEAFNAVQDLLAHMQRHVESPFSCHICDSSYSKRDDCLEHMKSLHVNEYRQLTSNGPSEKMVGDKVNASPQSLNNNYIESDKSGEMGDSNKCLDYKNCQVSCSFCLKKLWTADDLRRHMKLHAGKKLYSCDLCELEFSQKHSMIRHRRSHASSAPPMQDSTDEDAAPPEVTLPCSLKKHSQNSLLYMIPPAKSTPLPASNWSPSKPSTSSFQEKAAGTIKKDAKQDEGSTDLIQNLLGIDDSSVLDQMLDSAEKAAHILGMNKV